MKRAEDCHLGKILCPGPMYLTVNKRVIDSLPEFKIVYFGVGKRNIVESRLYKGSPFLVETESIDKQPQGVKIYVTITSATKYRLETVGEIKVAKEKKFGARYSDYGFNFIINLRDPEHFTFRPEDSNKYYFSFAGSEDLASYYMGKLD